MALYYLHVDGTGCLDPGDIQHANKTTEREADNGYYPSGELLTYECHKGFLVDGMKRRQETFCMGNGTWGDVLLNCTGIQKYGYGPLFLQ